MYGGDRYADDADLYQPGRPRQQAAGDRYNDDADLYQPGRRQHLQPNHSPSPHQVKQHSQVQSKISHAQW